MKNFLRNLTVLALTLALALLCMSSCDLPDADPDGDPSLQPTPDKIVYSLVLDASKTELSRGESVTLSAVLKAAGQEDVPSEDTEYEIVSGSEYATVSGNTLTVLSTAPHGAVIKLQAIEGATKSNELSLTVSVPATSVTASAGGVTNVIAGQSVILNYTVAPTGAQSDVVWTITEGATLAQISGNVLVVNGGAATGSTIKVKASVGSVSSEELELTVGYPLESISISALGSLNIIAGTSAQVSVTALPSNATDANYSLVFVNDCSDYATISGNVITAAADAVTGSTIQVKAVAGDKESNVITYTVGYPLTSISASLIGSANVNPGSTVQLSAAITPANATNGAYQWVITEGADYAEIVGNAISIKSGATIGASVKVKAVAGTVSSNEIVISVGTPIESLTIASTAPAVLDRGGIYPVTLSATPTGASLNAVSWVITEGADYASVASGLLMISSNTPAGTEIKLHAASGSISSNELSFTVGVKLQSLTISLNGSENVDPNSSRSISATLNPANASDTLISWIIDTNAEYATISGGVITVDSDAPIGAEITFHAEIGDVKSNTITIIAGTPITAIEISTPADTDIVKGDNAVLDVSLTPAGTSASLISWVISEGSEYASISGSILTVSKTAPTSASIKVKAVFSSVESNELVFTVMPTQEEINATSYVINLSASNVTVDKKGATSPVVVGTVYNMNFDTVSGIDIEYSVTSGEQYLQIVKNGNSCSFVANGHGQATVTATIPGTSATATVSVNVIVPPDAIDLPEMFKERTDIVYSFSKVDPDTGAAEALPFVPGIRGASLACRDYVITFMHSTGATGDEVAVYENGAITFNRTGRITAIVSSSSGSRVEASTAYTFDINEGYNVYTFAQLRDRIMSPDYDGQIVNMVVLEKPVSNYETSYVYGFDMVPPSALEDLDAKYAHLGSEASAYIVNEIFNGDGQVTEYADADGNGNANRIQALNKSVWVNGNNHRIDASQMRTFTLEEYNAYLATCQKVEHDPNVYELFTIMPSAATSEDDDVTRGAARTIDLYNLEVVGNCPVDFPGERSYTVVGCYTQGINVGVAAYRNYTTDYYVSCDGITASGFDAGIRIADAVGDSKLSNIHAYNCYANGLRVMSSILKIDNATFGQCGAFAIEISPKKSNAAGVNENENTQVTLAGAFDASTNLNSGNSMYFTKYEVMEGVTVPTIIAYNVAQHASQSSHLKNESGQFNFVCLMMINTSTLNPTDPSVYLNYSEVLYPAYQAGGIIDITEIPDGEIDTTHQYITMDVYAPISGLGTVGVGKAIFYNMNYAG